MNHDDLCNVNNISRGEREKMILCIEFLLTKNKLPIKQYKSYENMFIEYIISHINL